MTNNVNPKPSARPYRAPQRDAAATATRQAILQAARDLFTSQGYSRTTITAIAEGAGVAVDTVYSSVGRKPMLMRQLVETALSGQAVAVPALEREFVARVREAGGLQEKLEIYAAAVLATLQRLVPILVALWEAGVSDPSCRALWREISQRRAANMRLLAADLRGSGELRADLSDDDVGDIIWSLNAPEYYALLVNERGWAPQRFGAWLAEAWWRLLAASPAR